MNTQNLYTFFSDIECNALPGFQIASLDQQPETMEYHSKVLGNVGIEVFGVKREFQFAVYSGFEVDELERILKSRKHGQELRAEISTAIQVAAFLNVQIKYIDLNGKKIVL